VAAEPPLHNRWGQISAKGNQLHSPIVEILWHDCEKMENYSLDILSGIRYESTQ